MGVIEFRLNCISDPKASPRPTIYTTNLGRLLYPIILVDLNREGRSHQFCHKTILDCKAPGEHITSSVRHPLLPNAKDWVLGG